MMPRRGQQIRWERPEQRRFREVRSGNDPAVRMHRQPAVRGDVTENDLTVAQASSHLAVGVNATVGSGQTSVLAANAGDCVRDDAAGV